MRKIGFRTIRLMMNEGTWDNPSPFPKPRSAAPATFVVNGHPIFIKGTNWIPPQLFAGEITRQTFTELIDLACAAHFNCLRVWGGGIVNPTIVYSLGPRFKSQLIMRQLRPAVLHCFPQSWKQMARRATPA